MECYTFPLTIILNLFTEGKLVDIHPKSVLESHVDIVGLPAVDRVPQQSDMNEIFSKMTSMKQVWRAIPGVI